jgi:hypothetical protein
MIKKKKLLDKLKDLASVAVQGGLSETTRTCGNPGCICHRDPSRKHGPHLYLTFRTVDDRSSAMYVPRQHERQVRMAVKSWADLWETMVAVSHLNREELRDAIGQKPRKARATKDKGAIR